MSADSPTTGDRSLPPAESPAPAPLVSPTGSPGLNAVIDVVNSTAEPFQNVLNPELGTAARVEAGLNAVTGAMGAVADLVDTGFAVLTAPLAALFPALPAITLLGMHIGPPHTHTHPPSLIPPAPPIPLPSIGMLMGAGAVTVMIGGMPAARCGDIGISVTCGSLAPPFEVYTGSSNVFIGGARAARMGDLTKHCDPSSGGAPAAMDLIMNAMAMAAGAMGGNPGAMAQVAAETAMLALKAIMGKDPGLPPLPGALIGPPVPNVLIGGFPCPALGDMAQGALLGGLKKLLGKGLGKLKGKKGGGAAAKSGDSAPQRNNNAETCNGTHPVYLVTGENFDSFLDFSSGGLFEWRRHYTSARGRADGSQGHGWRHFYQRTLERRLHRATFTDWDGLRTEFDRFERGQNTTRADGYILERLGRGHFRIKHRGRPHLDFQGGEFDSELKLTKVVGEKSELELLYDRVGRLSALIETSRNGEPPRRFELRVDERGRIQQLWEMDARSAERPRATKPVLRAAYRYSDAGDLSLAQDSLGGQWTYEYDTFHRLIKQSDARGYRYTYHYDASGRCTDASGQDGLWWCHIEYFPEQHFTRYTEGDSATWEYHYDSDGVVTKIVDPYGGERTRSLDDQGRMTLEVDSGGRELRWLYDADGAHYARVDRFGNLFLPEREQPRLPNPFARELPSTSLGWLFAGSVEAAPEAMLGIDAAEIAALPPELRGYARGCFRVRSTSPDEELEIAPDAPRVELDALGRKVREQDAIGRKREWLYDGTGNQIAEIDRDGRRSTQETTSWNLLGARSDALGNTVKYEYSKLEQITAIIDPLGNESRYDYDLKQRLVRVHRHGRLREEYVYDAGDHFVEKRDGEGHVLFTNTIHENHLVERRVLASGGEHRFDYDARGRIIEASTDKHEIRFAYDVTGYRLADLRDGEGVVHTHHGSRSTVTRLFGRFKHAARFENAATQLVDGTGGVTRIEHGTAGVIKRFCPNGTTEVLQFNNAGQLEASLHYRSGRFGRPEGWAARYSYTAQGDMVQIADSDRGTTQYDIDVAHRLVAEHTPDGQEYFYLQDAAGNLLVRPGITSIGLDSGNRLRSSPREAFAYNSRNHLSERTNLGGATTRYHYDSFDMLVRIERAQPQYPLRPSFIQLLNGEPAIRSSHNTDVNWRSWFAEYDALGRRLTTRWGERLRQFYWDGDRLAAEIFPDGRLRIYQYACHDALSPLAFTDYPSRDASAGRTYHVFANAVGIPLSIENAEGKAVWWAKRVDPYGIVELSTANDIEYNLRWPGHYFDPETGLHYNRYRYYDPFLGRYLQSDPIGHQGSPTNLYGYCTNPIVQVDVLGLDHANRTGAADGSTQKGSDVDGMEGASAKKGGDGSDSPDARRKGPPTTEERALAASQGDTPAHREAREKVVRDFYGDRPGLGQARAEQDMGYGGDPPRANGNPKGYGIDLGKPVHVQDVPPPARVQQYVKNHGYPGNFADPEGGQTPDALGLSGDPAMRQPRTFDVPVTNPPQQGLVSGNGPVIDDWTDKANPVSTKGGGTQMTIDDTLKSLLSPQPQPW